MRTLIEAVYNRNLPHPMKKRLSLRALARQMGLPPGTFHDEIRRGTVPKPNLFKDREIRDYSADIAQVAIDAGNLDKCRPMKMNTTMAKLLRIEIADRHRSPCDALAHLRDRGIPDLPSERSVYDHIHHGDLGISSSQLPCKPTPDRKKRIKPRRSFKMPGNSPSKSAPTPKNAPSSDTGKWIASSPGSTARADCSCPSNARSTSTSSRSSVASPGAKSSGPSGAPSAAARSSRPWPSPPTTAANSSPATPRPDRT